MATTKTGTKADVVREILHKIGAVAETPPEGWKAQAEKELKKRKMEVHQTQIYELRRKELAKAQSLKGEESGVVPTPTTVASKKQKRRNGSKVQELNFDSALKIATFANTYGGLAKLQAHCTKIMALKGELK
jgi:hypothetical protein